MTIKHGVNSAHKNKTKFTKTSEVVQFIQGKRKKERNFRPLSSSEFVFFLFGFLQTFITSKQLLESLSSE